MKLTDIFIKKYPAPANREYLRDDQTGFCLQVLPTGVKTFYHMFKLNGKRYTIYLGQYPLTTLAEAREKYRKSLMLSSKGIVQKSDAPLPSPDLYIEAGEEITVGELAKLYQQQYSVLHHSGAWQQTLKGCIKNTILRVYNLYQYDKERRTAMLTWAWRLRNIIRQPVLVPWPTG